jgi:AcrR family transcriptional regulator
VESIKTPKKAEKQRKILDIAVKMFAKEGFRNTDVQVIADLANVGKGTIYRHFGNKEQFFLATSRYCLTQAGDFIQQEVGAEKDLPDLLSKFGTVGILREIAIAYAKFYQQLPEGVEIMIQERSEFRDSVYPSHLMYRAETRDELDKLIELGIKRGEIRSVNAKGVTNAFADLLYGCVVNGCLEGGTSKLIARIEEAVEMFLHGIVMHSNT